MKKKNKWWVLNAICVGWLAAFMVVAASEGHTWTALLDGVFLVLNLIIVAIHM